MIYSTSLLVSINVIWSRSISIIRDLKAEGGNHIQPHIFLYSAFVYLNAFKLFELATGLAAKNAGQ